MEAGDFPAPETLPVVSGGHIVAAGTPEDVARPG